MKFRSRQALVIDAVQWWPPGDPGHDATLLYEHAQGSTIPAGMIWQLSKTPGLGDDVFQLRTPKGDIPVSAGDYLITGPRGEKYAMRREQFEAGYEQIPTPHLYSNSVIDTYVAESEAEAASLHLRRLQDDGLVGDIDPGMELVFTLVGDDAQITIDVDDVGGPRKLTLSAAEWAAQSPKGFLCSTEY